MDTYTKAKRRVQKKKGFFSHLSIYLVMSVFFVIINAMEPHEVWCVYPIASWGIGVAIHYLGVFGFPFTRILSDEWEEEEIAKEMDRLEHDYPLEEDHLELREVHKRKPAVPKYDERDFV